MFSHSVILLSLKMPLLLSREQRNSPCRRPDCSRETLKLSTRARSWKQGISKNWEKQSVWAPSERQCWLEEKPSPDHLRARHGLRFTLLACLHGIIGYELVRAGFLKEQRPARCCRWDFRGNCCGAESDKPC